MRTLGRLLAILFVLFSILFVCGVFVYIYNVLTPKADGGLFVTRAGVPTPRAVEDMALYLYLQQRKDELLAPAGSDPTPVRFTISPGELPANVATRLEKQGLIKDAELFLNLVKYQKIGTKIQAGEYVLRKTMTMDEIIDAVQHGLAKMITITIRPGWRAEEIADYLATRGLKNYQRDQFLKLVREGKFDYAFLKDRPKTASPSLEGFLFPESYNVPYDITNDALIVLMLDTFGQRVTDKTRQAIAAQKMTLLQALTLASIVEREAVAANERPIIASVFLNRLKKKMFLQSDSTAQYAIGYQSATKQWWKSPVTIEELAAVNSPYNTYRNAGLPPGPICNPSLASIVAVAEPAQTEYLYFYSKGDGTHAFGKTYEEHLQNQQKYQK
ncbi:MAG: endolytic transglycosylase MltG [Chloroflexi bacterium]|nr:endolytic transglycosylase MltG [Chloroflexota bacterium]